MNSPPEITFASATYTFDEDDAVSANTTGIITITLDALSEVNASVSFAESDGTALITEDYLVDGISATINAGTLTTFNVQGVFDEIDEEDETFTLTLSSPSESSLVAQSQRPLL